MEILYNKRKILNPICHVVVPGSSDFEELAVVFSAHALCENKKCIWAVKYEVISRKKFIPVIQIEKPGVANLIIKRIQNKCIFCNTKIIL